MSIAMGRKKNEKVSKAVGVGMIASIFISIAFLAIANPLLNQILSLFGAKTEESLASSREYSVWILIGMPFFIVLNFLNPIVRTDGTPKIAMISNVSGGALNIILAAIFILPMNMGLTGAALATSIGIVVSFLISFVYIFKAKTFRLAWKDLIPDFKIFWEVVKLGFSSFRTQISVVIISVVSMNMLAKYGAESKYEANDPQAIIGVVMKVFSIFVNIAVGVAAGAQPIVGYNFGAKAYGRVRKILRYVLLATLGISVVATILFKMIPTQILSIFGSNLSSPELYMEFGEKSMRIYLRLIIFTLIQKVTSIFLQSIGKPAQATILSFIRDLIAFVPATLLLPLILGLDGVLWAAPIADLFGIAFSALFLILALTKIKKEEKQNVFSLEQRQLKSLAYWPSFSCAFCLARTKYGDCLHFIFGCDIVFVSKIK
jgi:putative MATE family efflux protein